MIRIVVAAGIAAAIASGCEKHEFLPATREERLAETDSAFAAMRFDTIVWTGDEQRLQEGNEVFAASCRRCHGPLGEGDGEFAAAEGLTVPSLVRPEWRYAGAADSVRRRVFYGHYPAMRTWGIAGLTPRDIDAVSAYIVSGLRPEVLGPPGQKPSP